MPGVRTEADLQTVIDKNPAYKQANLNPSQLLSFLHTQNQITNNPDLKTKLSGNKDFIAFDQNFQKIQNDLNIFPQKVNIIPETPPKPV